MGDQSQSLVPDTLLELRKSVLSSALLIFGIAIPVTVVMMTIQITLQSNLATENFLENAKDYIGIHNWIFVFAFPVLLVFYRKLPFNVSASLFLALLIIGGFLVAHRGGITTGTVLVNVTALLLGCLFFGRMGAILVFAGVLISLSAAGILLSGGYLNPADPEFWNQTNPNYWLRQIFTFLIMGVGIALIQLYSNERMIALSEGIHAMAEKDKQHRVALAESRRIESLSRLSGGIAHDFNNTLTVMIGNAELAMMELDETHPARENIRKILDSGQSASEMTKQLLTIGRKETSNPELFNLQEVLEKVSASLQRLLPAYVDLEIEVIGDPDIYADPGMFQRVMYNLILNARDAMPDGGQVSVYCLEDTNVIPDFVKIVVSDNGMGMDEETLAQVFDPFFTTKGEEGTGLGLAILNAWVSNSGGRITVESAKGKGTTFTLWLLAREPADLNLL